MRYDDRLRTVLDSVAETPRDRAVRWRQIVELLARGAACADEPLFDEALGTIVSESGHVDDEVRMATARAIAPAQLPVRLISAIARDRLNVAAPVLAGARLTALEWGDVLATASSECRAFVHSLRSEETSSPQAPTAEPAPPVIPSISEVVARIERRQHREDTPELPASELAAAPLFRWESDEAGEIAWVDGVPRGPLIGRSIAGRDLDGAVDRSVERAFAERLPFSEALLELSGATPVAGRWRISGAPAFDHSTGRFAGYRGIAEREGKILAVHEVTADPDSLRELAHEIKTPLNAIDGFAEIISGQYLGPADHRYRQRANEIVRHARLLLTAIEDLDFAAKLQSASRSDDAQVHLGKLVERIVPSLRQDAEEQGIAIEASRTTRDLTARVEPDLAERLITRMCTAVIGGAEAGDRLHLSVDSKGGRHAVSISLPSALLPSFGEEMLGSLDVNSRAFALRLVRGLARLAQADLVVKNDSVSILFPAAAWRGD